MSGVGWRKSAPGKYFRYGSATQDLVFCDVHSIITAIATGNKSLLIYDFGRKRGRREAQAPIEKGGGAISSLDRFCLVSRRVGRRSQCVGK